MKNIFAAALTAGALAMIGTAAEASSKGNATGQLAGLICDTTSSWDPNQNGLPYWQYRGYVSRDACVAAHVEWLKSGNDFPDWAL